ncbi:MAG TPA: mechanosensitive ion channel family protein [Nannocystis sp.]
MDDAFFPLPQLRWLALKLLPHAARGYADAAAELVLALVIGLLLRFAVLPFAVRAAARNPWPLDDIVAARLRDRALLWSLLGGLRLAMEDMPWRARSIATGEKVVSALLVLSVTVTLMRIVSEVVGRNQSPAGGGTTLIKYIINSLLLMAGVGIILGQFDVSVVPALTALGVGGLAVALAFQDTLANVFAGVNLSASRQIRVGDYIRVDDKIEGFVTDVGWRTTMLQTIENLLVYIPNKRLAEASVVTFNRPDPGVSVEVAFRVALDTDPEALEAIVADEIATARAALPGLRDAPPAIRFHVGEFALEVRAYVPILNFADRWRLRHDLLKRMLVRVRREGLVVPLPQRVLHVPADVSLPGPRDPSAPGSL